MKTCAVVASAVYKSECKTHLYKNSLTVIVKNTGICNHQSCTEVLRYIFQCSAVARGGARGARAPPIIMEETKVLID